MADHHDQMPDNRTTSATGSHRVSTQFVGRHLWQYAVVQDIFWISSIVGLLVIGYLLRSVLTPILIAFGLAYVLNPIVTICQERLHIPRVASIVSMLMLFVTTVLVAIWLLGPVLTTEIDQLLHRWPDYQNQIMSYTNAHDSVLQEWIKHLVPTDGQPVAGALAGKAPRGLELISHAFSTTVYLIACCVLTPIFYFFFAWRFDEYLHYALRLVPSKHRDEVRALAKKMDAVVGNYIRGRVIASLFLCAGFSFCWWLAGVPYSLALGIVTGILGAAPWVSTVGLPIAIVLKYSDVVAEGSIAFPWLAVIVWPSVGFFGIQAMENYVVTPWIQSTSMSMSPVMVITVLLIGGAAAGFYGLLLALPIAGCGQVIWQDVIYPRWEQWANDT